MMRNISFEKLKIFYFAAKHGSFTKAAKSLFVTEGAISQQIKDLEWKLGTALFNRRGPKIELTPEGEILLDLLHPLIHQVDDVVETFLNLVNSPKKPLKIAATQSIILNLLPPIIRNFEKENPDINLVIFNLPPPDIIEAVLAGNVDLGISPVLDSSDRLRTKDLVRFPWILVTPPDHPLSTRNEISLEDIASFPLIMPSEDIPHYSMLERLARGKGLTLNVTMKTARWEVIKKYVEIGLGIAIIPEICLSDSEKYRFWSMRVDKLFGCLEIALVTNPQRRLSNSTKKFSDILIENCKMIPSF